MTKSAVSAAIAEAAAEVKAEAAAAATTKTLHAANDPKKSVVVTTAQAKIIEAALADSTTSKSAKIRTIAATGLSQYKTAQLVGVIPQFVNNVLGRDKTKATKA